METKIIYRNKFFQIIIAILLPLILGWIGSLSATRYKEPWYTRLQRPAYTPPDIVFPLVWTSIYVMIGYASYRVYEKGYELGRAQGPLLLYFVHLLFNITWTTSFFYFHFIGFATIHIIIIFILLVFTGLLFYRIDKIAGILFVPYGLWVAFASAVCVAIFRMN
ncbi:unnamed protein product [Chironomus riparius]|uniref:Uncharacterized protein n=1 Tax=Chironomus riparius TaxID=315576 RepID=A0A9N9WP63_9DIPT|nr:unnamed protein product [Chironomus riparius]